ncbi:hypothetical protein PAPYR_4624 [Paratrimastix pyriformis]|uniref:Uncharacterized protein n=1 Tax=Paratrimastix pyriformis TaxID=342808 RepID=A0ABQ8UNP5_9EUKA|nr:hypothetical protein PAPYR_4624 [Paratrimastix pyriformis]
MTEAQIRAAELALEKELVRARFASMRCYREVMIATASRIVSHGLDDTSATAEIFAVYTRLNDQLRRIYQIPSADPDPLADFKTEWLHGVAQFYTELRKIISAAAAAPTAGVAPSPPQRSPDSGFLFEHAISLPKSLGRNANCKGPSGAARAHAHEGQRVLHRLPREPARECSKLLFAGASLALTWAEEEEPRFLRNSGASKTPDLVFTEVDEFLVHTTNEFEIQAAQGNSECRRPGTAGYDSSAAAKPGKKACDPVAASRAPAPAAPAPAAPAPAAPAPAAPAPAAPAPAAPTTDPLANELAAADPSIGASELGRIARCVEQWQT